MKLPVLVYHQITKSAPSGQFSEFAVPIEHFEQQMQFLHEKNYQAISLLEYLHSSGDAKASLGKRFVITFDDGFEDFYSLAYPILQKYRYTATMFLVTDYVGGKNNWSNKARNPLLTWEQVKIMHDGGISFGSHTCTHPRLTNQTEDQIRRELVLSKQSLESRLGKGPMFFAYPHGDSNLEIQQMVREAGYEAACGVDRGINGRFNIWRETCFSYDTVLTFAIKLTVWPTYIRHLREETKLAELSRRIKYKFLPEKKQNGNSTG